MNALPSAHEGKDEPYDEDQRNHYPRTGPIQFQDHHDHRAQGNQAREGNVNPQHRVRDGLSESTRDLTGSAIYQQWFLPRLR